LILGPSSIKATRPLGRLKSQAGIFIVKTDYNKIFPMVGVYVSKFQGLGECK
jgi:hypothetical protein